MEGVAVFLCGGFVVLLHGRDDDTDEEVEDGEAGEQDEGDEEQPRRSDALP